MDRPVAYKVKSEGRLEVHRVEMARLASNQGTSGMPAIVVVSRAVLLSEIAAGMIDESDIVFARDGDWQNAILVVAPKESDQGNHAREVEHGLTSGDEQFLDSIPVEIPELRNLGQTLLSSLRSSGMPGTLTEAGNGRWVNTPINSFTLKVQPRKKNFQFTIYGNPDTYDHGGFLLSDQNSYSRGWINGTDDVKRFVEFATEAQRRRGRK
jgi:hypothetical protein